jgi:hypothetical protein
MFNRIRKLKASAILSNNSFYSARNYLTQSFSTKNLLIIKAKNNIVEPNTEAIRVQNKKDIEAEVVEYLNEKVEYFCTLIIDPTLRRGKRVDQATHASGCIVTLDSKALKIIPHSSVDFGYNHLSRSFSLFNNEMAEVKDVQPEEYYKREGVYHPYTKLERTMFLNTKLEDKTRYFIFIPITPNEAKSIKVNIDKEHSLKNMYNRQEYNCAHALLKCFAPNTYNNLISIDMKETELKGLTPQQAAIYIIYDRIGKTEEIQEIIHRSELYLPPNKRGDNLEKTLAEEINIKIKP